MGFVGINIYEMNARISEFESNVQRAIDAFCDGGKNFFDDLGRCWYSPNAVSFSNTYGSILYDSTVTDVLNYFQDYGSRFSLSCNMIARANGLQQEFGEPTFHVKTNGFPLLKEAGPNGEVGMDINAISPIVQEYYRCLEYGLGVIESVRTDFPIYDNDEVLQTTLRDSYNAIVEKIKMNYKEAMQVFLSEINRNKTNLQTTASQAASTIQSSGGVR